MVVFRADACAVVGVPAVVDPARQAFVASRGRELGIQIPAAVAEWYAIDGAAEYLAEHSTNDIVPIEELGLAAGGRDLAARRLLLAVENQYCCDWVVSLPPVGLASHDVPLPGIGTSSDHQTSWERATDPEVCWFRRRPGCMAARQPPATLRSRSPLARRLPANHQPPAARCSAAMPYQLTSRSNPVALDRRCGRSATCSPRVPPWSSPISLLGRCGAASPQVQVVRPLLLVEVLDRIAQQDARSCGGMGV
jgi:hypothetical protein